MRQASPAVKHTAFDVEKNAQFALQVFDAYYRTPDPTGKIYTNFPDFFLINPKLLELGELDIHSQEKRLLEECKRRAIARGGYIGVSKYFDEKFGYHWIKLSVSPYELGDASDGRKSEFFYVLNKFIEFTRKNPGMYGDLSEDCDSDSDLALMLRDIKVHAERLNEKLELYPESMLVEFDTDWPTTEVKKLLARVEESDQGWSQLFLKHLRDAMRKKVGLPGKRDTSIRNKGHALQHDPGLMRRGFDDVRSHREPVMESVLDSARVRATAIARLSADASGKALKAEEEKIRLEALAVVAARKQIADAEAASQAAMQRIEQLREMRLAQEAKVRELEHEHVQSEALAIEAARQRLEVAEHVRQQAEQRRLLETELLERELFKLDQERALRLRIAERMASVDRASSVIQERVQSEIKAAQSAQAGAVEAQVQVSRTIDSTDHLNRSAHDVSSHQTSIQGSVPSRMIGEQAVPDVTSQMRKSPEFPHLGKDELITLDFKAFKSARVEPKVVSQVDDSGSNPFAYEERLVAQQAGSEAVEVTGVQSGKVPERGYRNQPAVYMLKLSGMVATVFVVIFLAIKLAFPEHTETTVKPDQPKPIAFPNEAARTDEARNAAAVGPQSPESETPAGSITLRMTDHLSVKQMP